MKRHLCAAALFALAALPDWASGCWVRGTPPVYGYTYCVPVYYAPPVYCPPPAFVYPCPPVGFVPRAAPPMRAPKVEAKPQSRSDEPLSKPLSEPVKPAGNTEPAPGPKPKPEVPFVTPDPITPPAKLDFPGIDVPVPPLPVPVKPEPKAPPKVTIEEPKLPPLVLPTKPEPKFEEPKLPPIGAPAKPDDGAPKLPSIEMPKLDAPKLDAPKLPAIELPGAPAIPQPAPAPDGLPPLALPPDAPVAPLKVEAKASPLAGRELKVSVFAAAGTNAVAANGLRKVGFYNHTARDLQLTIEGKKVKLPAMTYLHAQLPPVFVWQCGDRPAERATVPDTASGIDVLFRE